MITISYPKIGSGRVQRDIPFTPGKTLKTYFHEEKLTALRLRAAVMRADTRERLPSGYVPKDGDHIRLELTGARNVV